MKRPLVYLALTLLAVLVSVNTLDHAFVLDDEVVILQNSFVQKGTSGIKDILSNDTFAGYARVGEGNSVLPGGRYRPLSLVMFAVIYEFAEAEPQVYHAVTILLFVCLVLVLFSFFSLMLKEIPHGDIISLFSAMLFAVHPVHAEVVANVKSCDEILALLFGTLSMFAMLKAFDEKPKNWMAVSVVAMLLAGMAKESAVMLAVAGPLSLWFFRHASIRQVMKFGLPMFLGAIIYVIIRTMVLADMQVMDMAADPLNDPFLVWRDDAWVSYTGVERLATISYVAWKYLQLLVFPYPLTHDYYPFVIETHAFSNVFDWLGILSMLGLLVGGLWCLWKRLPIGFCILFYLVTLSLSLNLFFPVGTFMAERFLFIPSVGFCLGAVMLAMQWKQQFSRKMNWVLAPAVLVLLLFATAHMIRNRDWKNNHKIFGADLGTSEKSVKLQNDYGTLKLDQAMMTTDSLWRKGLIDTAFTHLDLAVKGHPTYYDALLALGAAAYYKGEYEIAVVSYQRAGTLYPEGNKAALGLYYSLQGFADAKAKLQQYAPALEALRSAQQMMGDTVIERKIRELELKQAAVGKQ